jgi:hypothetical protein
MSTILGGLHPWPHWPMTDALDPMAVCFVIALDVLSSPK